MLIVAAALVIVLTIGALVACGETNGATEQTPTVGEHKNETMGSGGAGNGPSGSPSPDDTKEAIGATEYFAKFNELSKSFGSTKIEKGADIYFRSEMSGLFGLKKENGEDDRSFELGFEIEAILDRTSQDENGEYTSERSAIRARAFSGDVDIVAISFFVNDPLSLYIDFAGSHIKLSAEFVYEDNNLNEMLGRFIGKALNKEFNFDFGNIKFAFSLNKVLDAIVEGTGKEWSPTVLLKSLAALIGIGDGQIEPDDQYDFGNSFLDSLLADTFNATKCGDEYSIVLDTRDTNALIHAVFSQLLGVDMLFKMNFKDVDGRLVDGVGFELGIPELQNSEGCYPYVGVRVNMLEMLPVEGKALHMPAELNEYKSNIAFKSEETIGPKGFKLSGSELREIRFSEAFRLDLVNPLETNETAAQIKLAMVNDALGEDVIFELSFVRGRLVLRLTPQVIFKEGTLVGDLCKKALDFVLGKLKESYPQLEARIADALYVGGAAGDRAKLQTDFKGIVVNDVSVRGILDSLVSSAIDAYENMPELPDISELPGLSEQKPSDAPSYEGWGVPSFEELQKWAPSNIMRKRILPALGEVLDLFTQLDDGKISVHTDNLLGLLLNMSNDLAGLEGEDRLTQSELFDRAIEGAASVLDALAEKGYIVYDQDTPDAMALMESAFEKLFEVFEIKDAPARLEGESFCKYALRLLLGSTSFDLSLDLTDGWKYSMSFGVAGATFSYSHSFTAWEGLDVQDLYDNAENGWLLFDFTDLENFVK